MGYIALGSALTYGMPWERGRPARFWSMTKDSEDKPKTILTEQDSAAVNLVVGDSASPGQEESRASAADSELEFTRPSLNIADKNDSERNARQDSNQATESIGTVIAGKYEILSLLGQGGMSSVYKIRHTLLNKILAIKMIHPHLASDKAAINRFKREAEATSRLDHPHVVNVHDFGVTDSGSPYIVMDYIKGVPLSQLISREKKLSPKRAMHIMSQACGALEHAHSRSIVHRDIKPSNIMLVNKDGDADYVKVVDFGIAQLVTEDNTLQKLTQTGQIFGTPLYMSPEQCQGHKLDARTDIYSLGCVMYEAITGKVPIEGANVYETIFKQINTLPEGIGAAVSERQLRMDLESIMFTAMAKEPGNRYSSMHHFQNEIDAVLTGQKKRNFFSGFINLRLILHHLRPGLSPMNSIMSLVLLAGVAMIAFTTFQGGQQSGANAQERWKKLDLSGQESFDNGELSKSRQQFTDSLKIAKEMQDRKLVLASLNEIADLNRVSKEDDKKISAEIEQYSNPDAPVLALQSQIRAEQDKLNAGAKPDQAALIQLRKFCDDAIDAAMSVSDDGDRKTAKAMLVPIKEIVEKTFGENDQLMFRCLHNLALVAHNTGDYSGAIEGYKQALALGDKVLSAGDPKLARTCRALGRAYIQTGRDYPEAEKLLERALEINRNSFGPESAQVAVCRYLLASLYFDEGRNAEAKREIASAVSIYDHAREADNRELASAYLMYGRVYNDVSYYKKALKVFEEMPAKDYPSMCQDLLRLADSAIELNPAQAENYLLRAQAMCDRFYPLDREMTLTNIYQTRAAIYKKEGKMQQSVESLKKALETAEKVFGQGSFKVIFILHEVAPALAATGANSEAESAYKQAFNLLKQNPNAQKTIGTAIFLDYVRFLNKLERKDDAKKLAEEWRQVLTVSR